MTKFLLDRGDKLRRLEEVPAASPLIFSSLLFEIELFELLLVSVLHDEDGAGCSRLTRMDGTPRCVV
jgi:hypothetical protein